LRNILLLTSPSISAQSKHRKKANDFINQFTVADFLNQLNVLLAQLLFQDQHHALVFAVTQIDAWQFASTSDNSRTIHSMLLRFPRSHRSFSFVHIGSIMPSIEINLCTRNFAQK
jgi:hypothetical protein